MPTLGWAADIVGTKQTKSVPHGADLPPPNTEAYKGTVVCSSFVFSPGTQPAFTPSDV